MTFIQAMEDGGGWPLNVFLTPDLKPFYGGTYWPPEAKSGRPSFIQVLNQMHQAWHERRDEVVKTSQEIQRQLQMAATLQALSGGRLVQEGRPEEVYWRPRTRFVAEFVGAANLVPVRVVERREMGVLVETDGGARVPVGHGGREWSVGARALLCLRPEALRIDEAALVPGGIAGTVASYIFEGGRALYDVAIRDAVIRVEMITSARVGRGFKPGDHVKVEVSPETSILLPAE